MIASQRKNFILETLHANGVIGIKETAQVLGVAEITVRRDFEKLEAEGRLKRVQGGAAYMEDPDGAELSMAVKLPKDMGKKEAVAAYAARAVQDGECVFLDGGTTMLPLAESLMKKNVRLITHNMLLLRKITRPIAQIVIIGGEYQPSYNMNLGPLAESMLKRFYFDRAFIGCSGIDLARREAYATEPGSREMKRIAMENAKVSHLLADASKFSKRGFLKLCDMDAFDTIITDSYPFEDEKPANLYVANK